MTDASLILVIVITINSLHHYFEADLASFGRSQNPSQKPQIIETSP